MSKEERPKEVREVRRGVTWMHLVACALATGVCTVLATFAVIAAPVPPAPGVSGLYIAAAVYVPISLWLGIWGCVAGYLSCVFMGLITGMPLPFLLWWSIADFVEGFVPLVAFRMFKADPELKMDKPTVLHSLLAILIIDLVLAAVAMLVPGISVTVTLLGSSTSMLFLASFVIAVGILLAIALVTKSKSWVLYVIFGIILAGVASGVIGAYGVVYYYGIPWNLYPVILFGWIFGDIIVLAAIGTPLLVILTPFIKRTYIYVRGYLS